MNYITVTEFTGWNPELDFSNYSDATISGMIQRASSRADNYVEYKLERESVSAELREGIVDSDGSLVIYTKKVPIISVSAIQLRLGAVTSNISLVDGNGNPRYNLPTSAERLVIPYQNIAYTGTFMMYDFYRLRNFQFFTATDYVAGYTADTMPNDLKDAINLLTKDIFVRQANPMDLQSMSQGAISMSFKNNEGGKSDSVLDAERILNKYKNYIA